MPREKVCDFAFIVLHTLPQKQAVKDGEGKIAKFVYMREKVAKEESLRFCLHHPSPPVEGHVGKMWIM